MHTITITYVMGAFQTFIFGNRKEEADAAFDKINTAMMDWKRFKNDSSETVTIKDSVGTTTFRLEHLATVSFADMAAAEPEQAAWAALNGRLAAVQKQSAKFAILESELDRASVPSSLQGSE